MTLEQSKLMPTRQLCDQASQSWSWLHMGPTLSGPLRGHHNEEKEKEKEKKIEYLI